MGYQNGTRPRNVANLEAISRLSHDVSFDLDDLRNDLVQDVDKDDVVESLEFIRESVRRLNRAIERMRRKERRRSFHRKDGGGIEEVK